MRDLGAALTLLSDPDDELALLTVLRSPLVALSDRTLVRVVAADKPPLRLAAVRRAAGALALPEGERLRLGRWLSVHDRLTRALDRLGPGGALRTLIEATDLEAVLAAGFHGEQRLADLARLCELADRRRRGGRQRARLRARAPGRDQRGRGRAPAQVLAENDDVVRVMTVHQSKGLEFGVVCVADCGAEEQMPRGRALYDRELGLAFRPHNPRTEVPAKAASYTRVRDHLIARAEAEALRLFYVAVTRARDLLVLSGERRNGRSWRAHVDGLLAELGDEAPALLRVVTGQPAGTPAPPPTEEPLAVTLPELGRGAALGPREAALAADLAHLSHARQTVARAAGPRPRPLGVVGSVTALADFQRCARRYRYHHELGLEEHPRPDDAGGDDLGAPEPEPAPAGGLGARGRGALAHRVLERLDLGLAQKDPAEAVAAALAAEPTEAATPEELAKVRADATRWAESGAFRELGAGAPRGGPPRGALRTGRRGGRDGGAPPAQGSDRSPGAGRGRGRHRDRLQARPPRVGARSLVPAPVVRAGDRAADRPPPGARGPGLPG